jgi:SH3-like domain-containing protein
MFVGNEPVEAVVIQAEVEAEAEAEDKSETEAKVEAEAMPKLTHFSCSRQWCFDHFLE